MGWETRGNSRYYYRKKRQKGKVVSEYVGTGEVALMASQLDQEQKDTIREERAEMGLLEQKEAQLNTLIKRLIGGIFLISGFHKHKGQWRKKRNVR